MSAFVVSKKHIDSLVAFAIRHEYGAAPYFYWKGEPHRIDNPDEAGALLWAENVRSVNYRYTAQTEPEPYVFHWDTRVLDPLQIIKACNCLDYQSCETPEWKDTRAFAMLDSIRERAIKELPGYDGAQWEIE